MVGSNRNSVDMVFCGSFVLIVLSLVRHVQGLLTTEAMKGIGEWPTLLNRFRALRR